MLHNEVNEIASADGGTSHGQGSSRAVSASATIRFPGGVWYQCQRCGNCCRWPGFVRLSDADITAIAAFLGIEEIDFIQRYTRLRPQRDGLALIDKPNGECVFLDGIDCAIQPVKPRQCAGFPNAWNFPGWRDSCEAVEVRPAGFESGSTIDGAPR
ncbi:MAG: YkgJ family cysteine cluster protein [Terrimicrobiaceae bacterium]|nr:YkgJ family cysteine cluster protein [Terrimicrobiaceae bacterium]